MKNGNPRGCYLANITDAYLQRRRIISFAILSMFGMAYIILRLADICELAIFGKDKELDARATKLNSDVVLELLVANLKELLAFYLVRELAEFFHG